MDLVPSLSCVRTLFTTMICIHHRNLIIRNFQAHFNCVAGRTYHSCFLVLKLRLHSPTIISTRAGTGSGYTQDLLHHSAHFNLSSVYDRLVGLNTEYTEWNGEIRHHIFWRDLSKQLTTWGSRYAATPSTFSINNTQIHCHICIKFASSTKSYLQFSRWQSRTSQAADIDYSTQTLYFSALTDLYLCSPFGTLSLQK